MLLPIATFTSWKARESSDPRCRYGRAAGRECHCGETGTVDSAVRGRHSLRKLPCGGGFRAGSRISFHSCQPHKPRNQAGRTSAFEFALVCPHPRPLALARFEWSWWWPGECEQRARSTGGLPCKAWLWRAGHPGRAAASITYLDVEPAAEPGAGLPAGVHAVFLSGRARVPGDLRLRLPKRRLAGFVAVRIALAACADAAEILASPQFSPPTQASEISLSNE